MIAIMQTCILLVTRNISSGFYRLLPLSLLISLYHYKDVIHKNLPRIPYLHDGECFFSWNDVLTVANYASSETNDMPHQANSTKESLIEANCSKELPI